MPQFTHQLQHWKQINALTSKYGLKLGIKLEPDFIFGVYENASLCHQYISSANFQKEMNGEYKENISPLGWLHFEGMNCEEKKNKYTAI